MIAVLREGVETKARGGASYIAAIDASHLRIDTEVEVRITASVSRRPRSLLKASTSEEEEEEEMRRWRIDIADMDLG
jgi:hypothetical protein